MASRLPTPGSDDGTWGDILNDFLSQAHNTDGSLKPLTQSQIQNLTADLAVKAGTADLNAKVSNSDLDTKTAALVGNASSTTNSALRAAYVNLDNLPVNPRDNPAWNPAPGADNGAMVQVILDNLYANGGGTLYLNTVLNTSVALTTGSGVRIIGSNPFVSVIRALSAFPANTPVVRLDRSGGVTPEFYNRLESITIDCNDIADTGVYSQSCQEQGGLIDCRIVKWRSKGIHLKGSAVMHCNMDDLWVYSSTQASPTGAVALTMEQLGGTVSVRRGSFINTANTAASQANGVYVLGSTAVAFDTVHLEGGSIVLDNSNASVTSATGHSTVPSLIRATTATSSVEWKNISRMGSTYTIEDSTSGTAQSYTATSGSTGNGGLVIGTNATLADLRVISSAGKSGTVSITDWLSPTLAILARVLRSGNIESRGDRFVRRNDGTGGYTISKLDGAVQWEMLWDNSTSNWLLRNAAGTNALAVTQAGAMKLSVFVSASRPSAASSGQGAMIFDSTLNKPVWSDGTNWRDASGTIV